MNPVEKLENTLPAGSPDKPAIPADQALTLKPERLAGSPACLNCGTVLQGPFCYYCGQPDRNFMRFFPSLIRDLMEDFLDLDSRFARTMKPLLFKPGRLTRDFLDGRRFRYTPPLRLYIFASLLFFLMAATFSTNAIRIGMEETPDGSDVQLQLGLDAPGDNEDLDALLAEVDKNGDNIVTLENLDEFLEDVEHTRIEAENTDEDDSGPDKIYFNDEPWDAETNPVVIPGMPDFVNDWVNTEVGESPQKAREIEKNPNLIVDKIFDVLPLSMFILLPVAALLFKFWYLFAKRYYVEHLILALHNHAYVFVSLIIVLIIGIFENAFTALGWLRANEVAGWINIVVLAWVPLYFLLALKHVYRQGWTLTLLKYGAIGISYMVLLAFVTATVTLASFILM